MLSPVVMVKWEILYSLYRYEDVSCTHESLNVVIKRVSQASLPPLERHSLRHDERKKKGTQHEREVGLTGLKNSFKTKGD